MSLSNYLISAYNIYIMLDKKFIMKHGKNIAVGAVLCAYILLDLSVPEIFTYHVNTIIGLVLACMVVLWSFSIFHPFIGILALALLIKIIITNRNPSHLDVPSAITETMKEGNDDEDVEDFTSQAPSMGGPLPDAPVSTLEEEVISNMAPPMTSGGDGFGNTQVAPVLAKSQGSDLNE